MRRMIAAAASALILAGCGSGHPNAVTYCADAIYDGVQTGGQPFGTAVHAHACKGLNGAQLQRAALEARKAIKTGTIPG